MDPEVKPLKGAQGSDAYIGQLILYPRWHFREIMAGNQPIAFKVAKCKCQHALRDAVHLLFEL